MKRALTILIASLALAGVTGCASCQPGGYFSSLFAKRDCTVTSCPSQACPCPAPAQVCPHCRGQGCPACCRQALPPSAAMVAYPYYTVHGPRDYFAKNTPNIGP